MKKLFFRYLLFLSIITFLGLTGCTHPDKSREIIPTTHPGLVACIPPAQVAETAKVVKIIDGDTISVEIDGQHHRLRYIGINAPELNSAEHALAEQAANYNILLVEGQQVTLYRDKSETDRFERLLRYVTREDVFINYEMVRSGMAYARNYPPDSACREVLKYGERQARKEGLGLWAEK